MHEFLLAVDDSPQKFELLIGIARREATFQPMRDFDCKLSQSSTKKYPVGLPGLSSLSPTWYIFFFSLPGGEGSSDDLFKWFSCFFQVVTMQNSESSGLFVHFIQGFSEQSYVILFYDAQKLSLVWNHVRACCRSWYLYMTIYYYYLFVLVLRSLFQGFPKTGSFDFGVLGDVIWPHLVSMNT